jgi:hypothetical protein
VIRLKGFVDLTIGETACFRSKPLRVRVRVAGVTCYGTLSKRRKHIMGFTMDAAGPDSSVEVEVVATDEKGNEIGPVPVRLTFTEVDENVITFTEGSEAGKYTAVAKGPATHSVVAIASADDPSQVGLVDVTVKPGPPKNLDLRRVTAA